MDYLEEGSPVTFGPGAYEQYSGEFVKDVDGKALVLVHNPEEMVVKVSYEQLRATRPERDIWDEADDAYAASKESAD